MSHYFPSIFPGIPFLQEIPSLLPSPGSGRGLSGSKRKGASDENDGGCGKDSSPRGVIFFIGKEGYKDPCDDYETDDEEENLFERGMNTAVYGV
eukprot:scaffold4611_cov45-Cyclotella_meneghiniana.AAC.4